MTGTTLKFNNIRVNKKDVHMYKKPTDLMWVNVNQIIVSEKYNYNEDGLKYFIGYQKGEVVNPLCIILPHMRGYKSTLNTGAWACLFWLNIIKYGNSTDKFGVWLKIN